MRRNIQKCISLFLTAAMLLSLIGCTGKDPEMPPDKLEQTVPTTEPTTPPDPMEVYLDSLSDEELVGQLFLARYPGQDTALEAIRTRHIGNFILFTADFAPNTPETMAAEIADLQNNAKIPLLIATDEEGGAVNRVSYHPQYRSSRFQSMRKLYQADGTEGLLANEREKCDLLLSVGVNVNMAPVCDITTDPDAFMYIRSLGLSPQETGNNIAKIVELMGSKGVGSVLKHFPGYGNNTDTHIGTAVDSRPLAVLEEQDLVPFRSGIQAGCDAILVSHTIVACLDETTPASLSPAAVGYLRDTMGFTGVIVTDDLVMDAITDVYGVGESAVLAILAGNDLLCSSDYEEQYDAVLQAVKDGRITKDRLRESVRRILAWKIELSLITL